MLQIYDEVIQFWSITLQTTLLECAYGTVCDSISWRLGAVIPNAKGAGYWDPDEVTESQVYMRAS